MPWGETTLGSTTFVYRAVVQDVHDGDTVNMSIDLGFFVWSRQSCRLLGLNAIELNRPGGKEARDHLAGLIPVGSVVKLESVKPDKFAGRFDAVITNSSGVNVNEQMIADGYAVAWSGVGPRPLPLWPL